MLRMKCWRGFAWMAMAAVCLLMNVKMTVADDPSAPVAADDQAEQPQAAATEEASKEETVDRYAVPDGGLDELVAFIDGLQSFRPDNATDYFAHRSKSPLALKAAAQKIMALKPAADSGAMKKATGILLQDDVARLGRADGDQQREILDRLIAHLTETGIGQQEMGLAMNAARGLEFGGAEDLAAEAYLTFGEMLKKSDSPQLRSYADMFAGSARRLELIGDDLELDGTKLDGAAFEIGELKGKVVLIDFWATWCGPCRAEFPNIKSVYDKYHEQGFEVVGVSLDRDRQALESYVEEKQVPWITLHERDTDGKNPATARYGIMGIPAMFLVGRDGKVISTHARGEELTRLLGEQFKDVPAAEKAGS